MRNFGAGEQIELHYQYSDLNLSGCFQLSTEASLSGGLCMFDKFTVNGNEYCTAGTFSNPSGEYVVAASRFTWVTGSSLLGITNITVCPGNNLSCLASSTIQPTTGSLSESSCTSLGIDSRRDCSFTCSQFTCSDAIYASEPFLGSRECVCSGCIAGSSDSTSFIECVDNHDWTYIIIVGAMVLFCCLIVCFQCLHKQQVRVTPADFEFVEVVHQNVTHNGVLQETPRNATSMAVPPRYEEHASNVQDLNHSQVQCICRIRMNTQWFELV